MQELQHTETQLITGNGPVTSDLQLEALKIIEPTPSENSGHVDMGGMYPLASFDEIYNSGRIKSLGR